MRIHIKITGYSSSFSGNHVFYYQCEAVDNAFVSDRDGTWLHPMEKAIFDPNDDLSIFEDSEFVEIDVSSQKKDIFIKKFEELLKKEPINTQLNSIQLNQLANQAKEEVLNSAIPQEEPKVKKQPICANADQSIRIHNEVKIYIKASQHHNFWAKSKDRIKNKIQHLKENNRLPRF